MKHSCSILSVARTVALTSATMLTSIGSWASCSISESAPRSTVTTLGSTGTFAYGFAVSGVVGSCVAFYGADRYAVDSFELPYFGDAGITNISSPLGWSWQIENVDSFGLGNGAQTLVWTLDVGQGIQAVTDPVDAQTLAGFGFTASFDSVEAPAGMTLSNGIFITIDPALPGSPEALGAGLVPADFTSAVPEPATWAAYLAGLSLLLVVKRKRS